MTIAERINSERVVLIGWNRAILLQLAHPLVAAGVLEHSAFRGSVAQAAVRAHHTVSAMLALTFGDEARRKAAVEGIRSIHRRVHGRLPIDAGRFPAGTPYSAEDPALLLWVHATLIDSVADIYDRVVAPLSPDELDQLCREAAPLVADLGGDDASTPRTWKALQAYMEGVYADGTLEVMPAARQLGHAVLAPTVAGVPLPLAGLNRLVTAGLLPPAIRAAYGFTWNEARERRFERALAVVRTARRILPATLTHWRDARRLGIRP